MPRSPIVFLAALFLSAGVHAAGPEQVRLPSSKGFSQLAADLKNAVKTHEMLVVTQACASCGAKARGLTIPGNTVIGVYRNDFAIRMLDADIDAGIEAPIRFYVTQQGDGTSMLSWRKPSDVFAPYGNAELDVMADELDGIFMAIAEDALK